MLVDCSSLSISIQRFLNPILLQHLTSVLLNRRALIKSKILEDGTHHLSLHFTQCFESGRLSVWRP